jgi:UDP-N-acetylmuramyl pentapeptide phosphotransferase/UDP-N-acetylglucosamine-1-phosphate transferase
MKTLGIILTFIGIIMMLYTGFNYITTKKVVDVGSIQIDKKENHAVQWSPIIGGVLLLSGIIVVLSTGKKTISRG